MTVGYPSVLDHRHLGPDPLVPALDLVPGVLRALGIDKHGIHARDEGLIIFNVKGGRPMSGSVISQGLHYGVGVPLVPFGKGFQEGILEPMYTIYEHGPLDSMKETAQVMFHFRPICVSALCASFQSKTVLRQTNR